MPCHSDLGNPGGTSMKKHGPPPCGMYSVGSFAAGTQVTGGAAVISVAGGGEPRRHTTALRPHSPQATA